MSNRNRAHDLRRDLILDDSLQEFLNMEQIQQQIEALRVQSEEMANFRAHYFQLAAQQEAQQGAQQAAQQATHQVAQQAGHYQDNYVDDDNDSLDGHPLNEETRYEDMGKLPDIVKDLPKFDGNRVHYSTWVIDVQGVIDDFVRFKRTGQYQTVLKAIRRKIIGEADETLNNKNVPLSWREIKAALAVHYSDKRDLMTLTNQLTHMMKDKQETLEQYYAKVQEIHSMMMNCIRMDSDFKCKAETRGAIKVYTRLSLDTFIRGVGNPLSLFMRNANPILTSLVQAYNYSLNYQNTEYRSAMVAQPVTSAPQPAPRNLRYNNNRPQYVNQPFAAPRQQINQQNYAQGQYNNQQNFAPRQNNNGFAPQRFPTAGQQFPAAVQQAPAAVQQFPTQEPMDVDRSTRTRQMNNQPKQFNQNRGAVRNSQETESWRAQAPQQKRMAHVALVDEDDDEISAYFNLADKETDNGNFQLVPEEAQQT